MFVGSDIWNIETENREASKPFEKKLESRVSDIENIGNGKSRIRQIPLRKIWLCGFWDRFLEIGYCVLEIGNSKSQSGREKNISTKAWIWVSDIWDIGNRKSRTWQITMVSKLNLSDLPCFGNRKSVIVFWKWKI